MSNRVATASRGRAVRRRDVAAPLGAMARCRCCCRVARCGAATRRCRLPRGRSALECAPLVLIELRGGNDGLNTVVPYAEDAYKRLRPAIHLPEDQLLALDDHFALHRALAPLLPAWQAR